MIKRGEDLTFDWYNQLMPRESGHGVAIVDINEESLGKEGQWPWPRPLIGKLPLILRKDLGAKVVAFDMVFSEVDRTSPGEIAKHMDDNPQEKEAREILQSLPDNDEVFAREIKEAGNVVTGFVATDQPTGTRVITKVKIEPRTGPDTINPALYVPFYPYYAHSLQNIVNAADGNGSFIPPEEEDSVIRRILTIVGYQKPDKTVEFYPSLSLEALRLFQDDDTYKAKYILNLHRREEHAGIEGIKVGDYGIPTEDDGSFRIYYSRGPRKDFYIPAWQVLAIDDIDKTQDIKKKQQLKKLKEDLKERVQGKIIFIGTSAVGLRDLRSSTLGETLSGSQAHAEGVEQILNRQFLVRPEYSKAKELLITAAVSLSIIFLTPFIGTGTLALVVLLLIGGGFAEAFHAYKLEGLLIDPVYPSLSIVIIFILSSILTNLRTETEKKAIRNAFGYYISPALMEELASNPDKLKLGGEVREISVMFTDIRNFTSISESMDPAELIKMMNDFLTPMTSCVLNNRGTIDKYMGDAMMAFWNAPLDDPDHAQHACTSALQMLEALKVVNTSLRDHAEKAGKPFKELKAGIGIHTGRASVGNMGSKQRFAYSALGDTVNLASRLEGQTKGYGISAMISEEVRKQATAFAALEIDLLTVKGRKEPERIYTLLGDAAYAASPAFKEIEALQECMLAAYRAQRWDEALALAGQAEALRPDLNGLYALYRQRIADFKTTPPAAGWQGGWVAKEKS